MADTLDIAKLTKKERLDLIGELWDSLAPEDVQLSPEQEAELGRRMATFKADAKAGIAWDEFKTELKKQFR
ncbi:addiction module protein [Variibacter gotjawalensis]|nr:addiction module protein [Variibacter gotjawalensis]NIK47581.1 putative addiction module component (TIGR02574 family) [Variibacter gotjawalensis]